MKKLFCGVFPRHCSKFKKKRIICSLCSIHDPKSSLETPVYCEIHDDHNKNHHKKEKQSKIIMFENRQESQMESVVMVSGAL